MMCLFFSQKNPSYFPASILFKQNVYLGVVFSGITLPLPQKIEEIGGSLGTMLLPKTNISRSKGARTQKGKDRLPANIFQQILLVAEILHHLGFMKPYK